MTHPRIAIRQNVRAQLIARASLTAIVPAARVFLSRYRDLVAEKELPAIRIYTQSEEIDPDSWEYAPREYSRRLDCVIEGAIRVPSSESKQLDDKLDALAWEIEKAMGADETLGGNASEANLARTAVEVDQDSEQTIGVITLVYRVDYTTHPSPDPSTLENFDQAYSALDVKGGDQVSADRLRDEIGDIYEGT